MICDNNKNQIRFDKAANASWKDVFFDSGAEEWSNRWFLDGLKAVINNTDHGMYYSAGSIEWDNASHAVLWTKESFKGDIMIEYDYTRMDTINRWVNIIYIQATGQGEKPYTKDISEWSDLRIIPYMDCYFNHMNTLHISYSAYGKDETCWDDDYLRARRYLPGSKEGLASTDLEPDNFKTKLFKPGEMYHIKIIKNSKDLFMEVSKENMRKLFAWDATQSPAVTEGRIGLRHMWMRAAVYQNFKISVRD